VSANIRGACQVFDQKKFLFPELFTTPATADLDLKNVKAYAAGELTRRNNDGNFRALPALRPRGHYVPKSYSHD
jgi:hypothetical protein